MKRILAILCFVLPALAAAAQKTGTTPKSDTVIIELAHTSKVIFTMTDRRDLEILKHYDFQSLFRDVLTKLEKNDTSALPGRDTTRAIASVPTDMPDFTPERVDDVNHDNDNRSDDNRHSSSNNDDWQVDIVANRHWGQTWQSFNFDLGTNNYVSNGKFPSSDNALYSVRPWGSWYLAINSVQRTRMGRKFFLEWSAGMSWYTFKFEKDNILMVKNDDGVQFIEDTRDVRFIKSKLSASFIQIAVIPVIDFSDNSRKPRMWDGFGESFRIGLGPYLGYRVGSHSKLVYNDGGRSKDKNRDSFYLNNIRYGARLQLGYRSTDLFFNYDLNELFSSGKGPNLNAFSFGVIF